MEEKKEDSTIKIHRILQGGPPAKPPILGKEKIYDGEEVIKIDEEGEAYIGKSIRTLQEKQNEDPQGNTQSLYKEEIDKIIKERFSGKFADHLDPMNSIPEDSILNAPVFSDDYGYCVVQEPYNKLMPK